MFRVKKDKQQPQFYLKKLLLIAIHDIFYRHQFQQTLLPLLYNIDHKEIFEIFEQILKFLKFLKSWKIMDLLYIWDFFKFLFGKFC